MIYIYTRVSTQGQADKGDSIANQIKKCQAWAVMEDLEDETDVIEEKAVSGGMPFKDRPQGKIVFEKLNANDILICYKLDRLFRNSLDALQTTEELTKMGVGLVLLNIHHKDITRDAVGKLVLSILSAVAEMEKDTIKVRMMDGKAARKSKGGYVGGVVPFGYRSIKDPNVEKGKILVEHEREQEIIDGLRIWIETGKTYQSFSDLMANDGMNKNASAWCKIYKRTSKGE